MYSLKERLSSSKLHIELFSISKLITAFVLTFVLTNLYVIAPQEAKVIETFEVSKVEVEYLRKAVEDNKKDSEYNLAIAQAKLTAATQAINTNKGLAELMLVLIRSGLLLALGFFIWGVFFWWFHVPKQINQD